MSDIQHLLELLKSDNHNKRYDACEELRVSRQPLPQQAIDALHSATNDPNPDVADGARRALALHTQQSKLEEAVEEEAGKLATNIVGINKGRDFAIGFFGWVIFHNIYFILVGRVIFSLSDVFGVSTKLLNSDAFVSIFLVLPVVIVPLVLIVMKKYWICIGSAIAILTTIGIWFFLGVFERWTLLYLLPFPTGILMLMQ
jgi:hypothetical protein